MSEDMRSKTGETAGASASAIDTASKRRLSRRLVYVLIAAVIFVGALLISSTSVVSILNDTLPTPKIADLAASTFAQSLQGIDLGQQSSGREDPVAEAPGGIDAVLSRQNAAQENETKDIDPPPPGSFLVADFDKNDATEREWVCPISSWISDNTDPTIRCVDAYDPLTRIGDQGYALKLWYDFESPNPSFGGLRIQFKQGMQTTLDLTGYQKLVLSVKGTSTKLGFTSRIKIEIKNKRGEASSVVVNGITTEWKRFEIPLSAFKDISNWSQMTEMILVLEQSFIDHREGILYFDDIMFTR